MLDVHLLSRTLIHAMSRANTMYRTTWLSQNDVITIYLNIFLDSPKPYLQNHFWSYGRRTYEVYFLRIAPVKISRKISKLCTVHFIWYLNDAISFALITLKRYILCITFVLRVFILCEHIRINRFKVSWFFSKLIN